jgi:serine/threonine-protein kinase
LAHYLAEMGLARVGEELGSFFADPPSYQRQLTERLCETLVQRSKHFVAEKRPARALSCLNQALALDHSHAGALQALEEINRSRQHRRRVRRRATVALTFSSVVLLAAGGYFLRQRLSRPPDYRPLGNRLAEVVLPEGSYPTAPRPASAEKGASPADTTPTAAFPMGAARVPAPKPTGAAAPERSSAKPVHGKLVPFTLQFRPYAYARIDAGDPTEELPQHELELSPGRHRLTFGCRFCEDRTEVFEVPADGTGLLRLLVQPKASSLVFRFLPADATVELEGERRTTAETQEHPFRVKFPTGVTQRKVEFQVTRPGFKPKRDTVTVLPDNSQLVRGNLVPE